LARIPERDPRFTQQVNLHGAPFGRDELAFSVLVHCQPQEEIMKAVSRFWLVLPFTFALASQAWAQQTGLVNVDLRNANFLSNIANHLNVSVSNVPITVQAPISVAATVCQVTVAVLANAINRRGASCYAQSSSAALNKIVQNVINVQHQ
jgi:hypothetical protein